MMLTVFVRELVETAPTKNPNSIVLSGYICKPPVYRTTPFNREIADLLIAVNRAYNKSDYIPCMGKKRAVRAKFKGGGQGCAFGKNSKPRISETPVRNGGSHHDGVRGFRFQARRVRRRRRIRSRRGIRFVRHALVRADGILNAKRRVKRRFFYGNPSKRQYHLQFS